VQDDDSRAAHLRFLENMERINRAMRGTQNFANHAALVAAEIARLEGRELDAERFYEQVIGSARESGLVHDEALANELAARFYAARGFGRVRQLDQLHPHPREEEPAPGPTATIGAPVEHLDIATVMKVSQAVSGETFLESLIDTVMRTAVEQAGAERGLLILARGSEQRIAADATTDGEALSVHLRDEPATAAMLPESVLNYVMRTQESVILDDASVENPFSTDPYIRQQRLRSIVCLPLLNQAKRIGALYLENNLAARVFSPGRIAVLKLLAAQAAISLENTRLDRDLAERETRIRRLFNADIIGIFIWDFDGRILEANDAFLRIVGYEREDLDAGRMRWADMTPPDLREREAERVREHKRTGALQPFEKEYFRKDGSRVPVLVGVTIFEEGGNQGVGFVLDLTERKQAEIALRESEEQWKAVFENNPVMYFMVDADGTILSVNPFGAEQLGYRVDELVGRSVTIVFYEPDRDAVLKNAAACFAQPGQAMSWELRKVRKSGEVIWVRETARATLINKRFVLLIVCEDITESRRATETLREVQTELAHANRVAALGQLTASIAHEINQPIAGVLNGGQAALRWLDRSDLEAARRSIERIIRDAARAGDVIGGLRALVKKVPPQTESFDINQAIYEVIVITRSEAVNNGISVGMQLGHGLPSVWGDRVQLQQVILNLVINAIEAMGDAGEGPRELTIKTAKSDSGAISVAVEDSGPGLDPAGLERVFEAFYTTKPGGMGMGLSICRSIVEAHGGKLEVAANEPRGAIFHFTVPARVEDL